MDIKINKNYAPVPFYRQFADPISTSVSESIDLVRRRFETVPSILVYCTTLYDVARQWPNFKKITQ